jgi:hypothetical protein
VTSNQKFLVQKDLESTLIYAMPPPDSAERLFFRYGSVETHLEIAPALTQETEPEK